VQNVILKFHPTIQKYTNGLSEHTVKINDLVDLRNSLEHLFPQLGIHIKRIRSGLNSRENIALVNTKKRVLDRDDYLIGTLRKSDTHFHVVPLFLGGGGEGGTQQLLLGAALIGIGFMMPGSTIILGMSIKAMVMKMGVSMVISGVMGMIMKTPKPSVTGGQTTDSEARIENKIFQGLQNTTQSNIPVPIIYGRTRVGGQFVSGEILSIQHGRNEFIKVSALFPPGAN
jgi:predicted phage tail protein